MQLIGGIRELIRYALVEEEWGSVNSENVGTVSLVYDHHTSDLADKLMKHQHLHITRRYYRPCMFTLMYITVLRLW